MAIATTYLTSLKNVSPILSAIQNAQAPPKFTTRFLEGLGFKNPADRLMIGVLKSLGFLSPGGEPTKRYFEYLDQGLSATVLAEGIREAYADLFQINTKANELSQVDVKNKLKTLTQGQVGDSALSKMAATFKALSTLADFKTIRKPPTTPQPAAEEEKKSEDSNSPPQFSTLPLGLVYNIQIVMPETRDSAVFDALFKSMKEHLLK
jgi:hypothetical protein